MYLHLGFASCGGVFYLYVCDYWRKRGIGWMSIFIIFSLGSGWTDWHGMGESGWHIRIVLYGMLYCNMHIERA